MMKCKMLLAVDHNGKAVEHKNVIIHENPYGIIAQLHLYEPMVYYYTNSNKCMITSDVQGIIYGNGALSVTTKNTIYYLKYIEDV